MKDPIGVSPLAVLIEGLRPPGEHHHKAAEGQTAIVRRLFSGAKTIDMLL